ncbi:histidine phosphotransferase family protein [Govanella unica]|uniref:Histidine phosphotransferase family protein n=1 Tax=Govanella unica TaxID=2975056 RepID=A0A9X3TX07_9PROT|nr:histidine phosphotransferase family protein [Govania unica]MDA5193164.1 histidine phosphotransferase family protein [Govania unica]
MTDPIAFSALLCSRLCHDLISPVGAFTNGLEILQDETDATMREQVVELLEQSASQTSNRLQFFRLAFGAAGGFGETVAMDSARDAAAAFFSGGKVMLEWRPAVQELSKDGLKALLNLVLVAGEALLRGGRLTVEGGRSNGALELVIHAEGERLMLKPEMEEVLGGRVAQADLTPKTAPAYLASIAAAAAGGGVDVRRVGENSVTLLLRLP